MYKRNYLSAIVLRALKYITLTATEEAVINGQAVVRSIDKLINNGFIPEVVIIHAGMGFGLFLKDILPNTPLIDILNGIFKQTQHSTFKEY